MTLFYTVILFSLLYLHSKLTYFHFFSQMKRSRPKVAASKNQLTEYELQRLQKLKVNAERMEALGSASLANKILENKTKALFCPSAMLNSTPENEDDASTSEYDGENEVETDNLTSGNRKASKQVCTSIFSFIQAVFIVYHGLHVISNALFSFCFIGFKASK